MKELNAYQQKTAENAKKKLEEIEKLKPILKAAVEGKVIRFDGSSGAQYFSDKDVHEFTYPADRYSIVKEKQKVYTFYYLAKNQGEIYSYSHTDFCKYSLVFEDIKNSLNNCTILKETVEEFEV